MRKALLFEPLPQYHVRCHLCAHRCLIPNGRQGLCRVRENRHGVLMTLVADGPIVEHVDPIEKKPFYHVLPASRSYSIATAGCNFHCLFCQNWQLSQMPKEERRIECTPTPAAQIVERALETGCQSIAYTYVEPTIFLEYALEIGMLAQNHGLANLFVTNGYQTPEAMTLLSPILTAANVDLKAFRESFYRSVLGARLQPVLDTLILMKQLHIWVEVTTLLIPGMNDSDEELRDIAEFIATHLDIDTPWHISRYFPSYRLNDAPPTPLATIQRAYEIGKAAGLHHIYAGNTPGSAYEHTYCAHCDTSLIKRHGFQILENRMIDGYCPDCHTPVVGIGMSTDMAHEAVAVT